MFSRSSSSDRPPRRLFRWSSSRESRQERVAGAALLFGAAVTLWLSTALPFSQQALLAGLWLVVLALLLRRGWLKLFGPILFYELVRLARRRRIAVERVSYGLFLAFILFSVFNSSRQVFDSTLHARDAARLADNFFSAFLVVQFGAVYLLTPAFAGAAIAVEKERRTLEFLLATDLRNREIVLGKLVSRLARMALFLLTGLPILALTQFLGGVDPDLVLAAFAATGLAMLSLASLSILCSVLARKSRNAIAATYLILFAYCLICGTLSLMDYPSLMSMPLTFGVDPWTLQDLVGFLQFGSPFAAMSHIGPALLTGRSLGDVLPELLGEWALFHLSVTTLCATWAVLRLRAIALRETSGSVKRQGARFARGIKRPPIKENPMTWKETHVETGIGFNRAGRLGFLFLVLLSWVPAILIVVQCSWSPYGLGWQSGVNKLAESMNDYVRIGGTLVGCVLLLGVGLRASGSVTSERDRQTLDSLLTTPLSNREILFAKWLGSILSVRLGWLWLGSIWAFGVVTGGLYLFAVPVLAIAWLVYAAFMASLGLWFSTAGRTTLRANVSTFAAAAILSVGHWLLWICCIPMMMGSGGSGLEEVAKFQAGALTPPFVLVLVATYPIDFERLNYAYAQEQLAWWFIIVPIGFVLWALFAVALWGAANESFEVKTSRERKRRPQKVAITAITGPQRPAV